VAPVVSPGHREGSTIPTGGQVRPAVRTSYVDDLSRVEGKDAMPGLMFRVNGRNLQGNPERVQLDLTDIDRF
jgi:hypothetical protein